jgi:hypothetical protein
MKKAFIFCHGWGFSPSFWKNIAPYFQNCLISFWDLGYFSEMPVQPVLDPSYEWWGVGHSLGFSYLVRSSLALKGIIGLQTFLKSPFLTEKLLQGYLKKTIQAFEEDPLATLRQFYKRCGMEEEISHLKLPQKERLFDDLLLLGTLDTENLFREKTLPCTILASQEDPIIPLAVISKNFAQFPHVRMAINQKAHHNLGYHEALWTYQHIRDFVKL